MLRKSSLVVALTFTLGALLASAEPAAKAPAKPDPRGSV